MLLRARSVFGRKFRSFSAASHGPVPFNEPGGQLFSSEKVLKKTYRVFCFISDYRANPLIGHRKFILPPTLEDWRLLLLFGSSNRIPGKSQLFL
jgi:hypothetical protein